MTIGAVTTRDDVAGGQRKTDGYWKHYGLFDVGSLRSTDNLTPTTAAGAGVEVLFVKTGTPTGYVQAIDRDAGLFRDLVIQGRNIALTPLSGGQVTVGGKRILGSAPLAAYQSGTGWGTPAAGAYYETDVKVGPIVFAGVQTRVDWAVTIYNIGGPKGNGSWVGLGLDGTMTWPVGVNSAPETGGWVVSLSGVIFLNPPAGSHRLAVFLKTDAGQTLFRGDTYQILVCTETG